MPPSLGLARPFALLIAVLSLAMLSVAPANASDKSLRSTVISAGKQLERAGESLEMPEDEESPSFAAEYQTGMRKLDGAFARYGRRIAAQRGSTGKGRQARKLLLKSTDAMRKSYALVTKMTLDEDEPSQHDLDKAARLSDASARDRRRAYRLLKIKLPAPLGEGAVVVTPDEGSSDDESSDDESSDDAGGDSDEDGGEAAAE